MSPLIDLKDAAVLLGVDYATARKYVRKGMLRAVRVPSLEHSGERRKIQVRAEDLEDFISGSEVGTKRRSKPPETAPNRRSRKGTKSVNKDWLQQYGG